jgi:hypothetical protein
VLDNLAEPSVKTKWNYSWAKLWQVSLFYRSKSEHLQKNVHDGSFVNTLGIEGKSLPHSVGVFFHAVKSSQMSYPVR